ncbi:MAG: type II secretion system minor pseudopilin GspH [Methylophilaceae bacterium]|nr:type II secretion system minor pseudopilin GspH [Methylophilaceae bacterium]
MLLKKYTGFTLIEILVVLSIMGIMLGLLAVNYGADERQNLQLEGHRLALLMSHASQTARTTGQPIAWQVNERGYQFLQYDPLARQWQVMGVNNVQSDTTLRERVWPEGLQLSEVNISGSISTIKKRQFEMIIFSPSGVNPAFDLTLQSSQSKLDIKGDMLGQVTDLPAIDLQ